MCFVCSLAKQQTVFKWKDAISRSPVSQGSAEQLDTWGGKTKHHPISYFLSNISAENYHNRIVYVKIIASHGWDVFWHTVKFKQFTVDKITTNLTLLEVACNTIKNLKRNALAVSQKVYYLSCLITSFSLVATGWVWFPQEKPLKLLQWPFTGSVIS